MVVFLLVFLKLGYEAARPFDMCGGGGEFCTSIGHLLSLGLGIRRWVDI